MKPIYNMLYVFLVMLISATVFLYIIMTLNKDWEKARWYDIYEKEIETYKKCIPYRPLCICPETQSMLDLNISELNISDLNITVGK